MRAPALATLLQFALGLLFGLGLILAGMADPAKVLAFLDLAAIPEGAWDPSLALVLLSVPALAGCSSGRAARGSTPTRPRPWRRWGCAGRGPSSPTGSAGGSRR